MKKSTSLPLVNENKSIRLVSMLGPFEYAHRNLLTIAKQEKQIDRYHHPLSCFEVEIRVYIGTLHLLHKKTFASDIQNSLSPYFQLFSFQFLLELPSDLFSLSHLQIELILTHRIAINEPVIIGTGKSNVGGELIFSVSKNENFSESAIVCDLLRAQIQFAETSVKPYLGEIPFLAGSVCNSFAAHLTTPIFTQMSQKIPKIPKPRFFKNNQIPQYKELTRIKMLLSLPSVLPMNQEDLDLIKKYPEYVSQTPSGYLKLCKAKQKIIKKTKPKSLPVSYALNLLTIENILGEDEYIAIDYLRSASKEEIVNSVFPLVQSTYDSPSITNFLSEIIIDDIELAVAVFWAFEIQNHPRNPFPHVVAKNFEKLKFPDDILQECLNGKIVMQKIRTIVEKAKTVPFKEQNVFVRNELLHLAVEHPFRLPLDPSFIVHKISPENFIIFGSTLRPIKIDLLNDQNQIFSVIFKVGDDMRQDALALSLIRYFDQYLKKFGQDLKLSPYKVLPISLDFGLCEFVVGAKAISKVLRDHGSISDYFVNPNAQDIFIRSSAGYSIISYVLGVGDRHLDNLLVTPQGLFLHVDFGFLFGREPKPWPVAIRVVESMTMAMGTEGYKTFLRLCSIAFICARKWSDELFCNLSIMRSAGLPHLPNEWSEISRFISDRLSLELSEAKAAAKIVETIEKSLSAQLPKIMEMLHQLSVDRKNK